MKMKMTENSIKEIGIVNSIIQCIKDTCPFPLDDSWLISDGIKNGKKFVIDGGLYPHELDVFEDFETDKITLGLSISTCSRMNCKGDYVRYPKEYEMGKACVLEEVLLENLRELEPQLKYFTIDINDYGLEDDGDNGWEHWMGFVLTPIQSVFEKEKEETREEIIDKIIESCEEDLTRSAVKKVCKWLVENSKHIRQHLLCVGDIQHYTNGKIISIGGVFLYVETDGDDTIIDLDTWAYYEKKGEGDNFSKEALKELYEKL